MTELKQGPLHTEHADLGATFAPFGGWEMPIQYPAGIVAEHTAVRENVGLFDVSHLGKALVAGPGAAAFVNSTLTNDLGRIAPGKAQYTLACNEKGGVIDDLIAYLVSDEEVFLVPNAANTAAVVERLVAAAPNGITVTNQHAEYAVLAVQGPKAADVLAAVGLPSELGYMSFADAEFDGHPVRICRTGYTGEHGYELLPRWAGAPALWAALLAEVTARGGQAAGLGARDTLRTEMGYPLHGHELTVDISPVQAGSTWAVGWKKDVFWGKESLVAEKETGPIRKLVGLLATEKGVPRAEMPVVAADGTELGMTTSGTFSPTKKVGIALALVDPSVKIGDNLSIKVRNRTLSVTVVKPPFVDSHVR